MDFLIEQERIKTKTGTCDWVEQSPSFKWPTTSLKSKAPYLSLRTLSRYKYSGILPSIKVEQTFQELATQWREETIGIASPTKKFLNLNYLRILTLGKSVIPLIIRELEVRPSDWFLALRVLSGENPVEPHEKDDFKLVTEAWIRWWKEKNIYEPSIISNFIVHQGKLAKLEW